jgi:hypothetical protein
MTMAKLTGMRRGTISGSRFGPCAAAVDEHDYRARAGNYTRSLHSDVLRVHIAAQEVRLNGKRLPRTSSQRALAPSPTNWMSTRDSFGPLVVLRARAGEKTGSVITLR